MSSELERERPEWAKSKELEDIRQKDLEKVSCFQYFDQHTRNRWSLEKYQL